MVLVPAGRGAQATTLRPRGRPKPAADKAGEARSADLIASLPLWHRPPTKGPTPDGETIRGGGALVGKGPVGSEAVEKMAAAILLCSVGADRGEGWPSETDAAAGAARRWIGGAWS